MKLHDYLKRTNQTQSTFGKKIGKSQQLVSGYCTGSLVPPRATAMKIVKATNGQVTLADLWPGMKVA